MKSPTSAIGLALLLSLPCAQASSATPGVHWADMPEPSAACRAGLAQAQDYLKTLPSTSMMAVRDGQVFASWAGATVAFPLSATSTIYMPAAAATVTMAPPAR